MQNLVRMKKSGMFRLGLTYYRLKSTIDKFIEGRSDHLLSVHVTILPNFEGKVVQTGT